MKVPTEHPIHLKLLSDGSFARLDQMAAVIEVALHVTGRKLMCLNTSGDPELS
jgi:hypothetical protein